MFKTFSSRQIKSRAYLSLESNYCCVDTYFGYRLGTPLKYQQNLITVKL